MLPLLGWPPHCLFRQLTGIPCPLCGMTTGVLALAHGRPGAALAANPAAPLFVLAVAITVALRVVSRDRLAASWQAFGRRLMPLRVPVLSLMWLFELRRFGVV